MTCWRPVAELWRRGGWEWGTERVSYPAGLRGLARLLSCRSFVAKRPEHQEEEALLVDLISLAPGSLREGMGAALSIPIRRVLYLNPCDTRDILWINNSPLPTFPGEVKVRVVYRKEVENPEFIPDPPRYKYSYTRTHTKNEKGPESSG